MERFIELARHLQASSGLHPIFVAAQDDEASPFCDFQVIAGAPLSRVKSLLRGASLFIGNDSGPAHMAAAFGIPVIVVFGSSDPAIWGPWRTISEVVYEPSGVADVPVQRVLEAVDRLRVHA